MVYASWIILDLMLSDTLILVLCFDVKFNYLMKFSFLMIMHNVGC